LIPKERNQRPLAPGEQVNGHANGRSLSRVASPDDGVILAFAGEIDLSTAEEFRDDLCELTDGEKGEVVLDLENCGFIDSTGLRTLIMLGRELRTRGQTLVLTGLKDAPRRVFEITGLLDGPDFVIRDRAEVMSLE
jgi:anti-anti-sigma factor